VIGDERWEWAIKARASSGSGKVRIKQVYPLPTEYLTLSITPSVVQSADLQSQKSPETVENNAGVGTVAWTNASNAKASDNSYATASQGSNEDAITNYLEFTNFKFAIPETASIVGVVSEIERKCSDLIKNKRFITDSTVHPVIGGVVQTGVNYALPETWPEVDAFAAYVWGASFPTPAQANNAGFGFALAARLFRTTGGAITASVDSARMTIAYTEANDPNRVCFATRSIELRSDGVFRQHETDDIWGPLIPEGQLLQAPTEGLEGREARYIVIPTQGDLGEASDAGTNALSAQTFIRPAYLFAPEGD
jgi:hypothetical protein